MRNAAAALTASMSSSPALQLPRSGSRDWFLRDSHWEDAHWILVPTSAVFKDRPAAIHWDFDVPDGLKFTHSRYASLLESAKQHVAEFRVGSTISRSGCASTSLVMYFQILRTFIRWMIEELRISYFAQGLGTAQPVSEQRILREIDRWWSQAG